MIKNDEQLDDLGRGLSVIQKKDGFKYGTDSVLLAKYVLKSNGILPRKEKLSVADLGTGTGILPLLLSRDERFAKITGLEIQEAYAEMAARSVAQNGLEERIKILQGDIKDAGKIFGRASMQAVITNPPYKKGGAGIPSAREDELIARHEVKCSLEDVIKSASEILEPGGAFFMVNRPERLADTMELLRRYKLEPKTMRMVYPKVTKIPSVFLISAVKCGGANLKVEEPLILMNEDGSETDEVREIYEY